MVRATLRESLIIADRKNRDDTVQSFMKLTDYHASCYLKASMPIRNETKMNQATADLFPVTQAKEPRPVLQYKDCGRAYLHIKRLLPIVSLTENPSFSDFCNQKIAPKPLTRPYDQNISAGKNTYVYDAHTYHTKVPPEGIKQLIEYHTDPGHIVLDPFCGSGMTGVAATEIGRKAVLSDLSPAAAFITYNHTVPAEYRAYLSAVEELLDEAAPLHRYLYQTPVRETGALTTMLYMVWSFGFVCHACNQEFILWDVARHEGKTVRESKITSQFNCPHCHTPQKKRGLARTRRYPVQVGYQNPYGGLKEATHDPETFDFEKLRDIDSQGIPDGLWYPTTRLSDGVNTKQPIVAGVERVDQFYTTRALWAFAHLWNRALEWPDHDIRVKLLFTLTSLYKRVTVCSEFRFWGGSGNTANFNVPSIMNEQNVFRAFKRKAETISWYFRDAPRLKRDVRVSCQSACSLYQLHDESVDYAFTDPPFGGNINYSEMNIIWESWLGVTTNNSEEAIINKCQRKDVPEYKDLLTRAFREIRRVLKKSAWMTVVFHNSSANVWSALQSAILDAGFDVRGTQTFDKKHGTFKQFVSDNAVGYDLVLHCQKSVGKIDRLTVPADVVAHARAFIKQRLAKEEKSYTVRYLHVNRPDEFDYRRLYADWLREAFGGLQITVGFADFRELVDNERKRVSTLP
jgi:DNA modification methylase